MRKVSCIYVVAVHAMLVLSRDLRADDPLYTAFLHFENVVKDGCNIDVLPDSIDWCDGKLNKGGKLPEYTECQSIYLKDVHLLCRNGRWIPLKHGRVRRRISDAYTAELNSTCSMFCAEDTSTFVGKSAPSFGFCPASVTLYPVGNDFGNETEIQHTWETPQASDEDGNITSLIQIVGPQSNSTFESSPSPGTSHVISYQAMDDDNLNWTCSFVITAEIPTCSPIVDITNGNSSCTDLNSRYSVCLLSCNYGYTINGTSSAVCQENGTWSYENDEIPQCVAVTCEDQIVTNSSDIKIVCDDVSDDNDTSKLSLFGSICWMECPNDFLLKNDVLMEVILQELSETVTTSIESNAKALQEADKAQIMADAAHDLAEELAVIAANAENTTTSTEMTLQTASDELDDLNKQYNHTLAQLEDKQEEYEYATSTGATNADNLLNEVKGLNETLIKLNAQIAIRQQDVNNLNSQLTVARDASVNARNEADQALLDADAAQALADDKKAIQEETDIATTLAFSNFNNQTANSNLPAAIVSSYAICTADGNWDIPGNPYCLDIHPPDMKCVPVVTRYLSSGQTSAVVTWTEPEVNDNSGNVTVLRISGPAPGINLALGQTIVTYQANDETGNLSPVCTVVINVNVYKCDDIATSIDDEYVEVTCDSFELGATCNLTCSYFYTLEGTSNVTCKQNSTTLQMYWDFIDTPTCTVELCAEPKALTNGEIECVSGTPDFDNITAGNETINTGITCIFTCNEGYMLPYKTDSVFKCSDEGVWNSEDFPTMCIETGGEMNIEYTFDLKYNATADCATENVSSFMEDWAALLAAEMPSYTACMMGYICEVGDMMSDCNDIYNIVTLQFKIVATCEGHATSLPLEATCDLEKDGAISLEEAITQSVDTKGVDINLTAEWLQRKPTSFPQCPSGAILVGSYCARCAAGHYYDTGQDTCLPCAVDTFSDTGSLNCNTCPSTSFALSTGSIECTAACAPGTYSSTGLEPCATCQTGTYQSGEKENTCVTCPVNTWTTGEGSDSALDCVAYDLYFDADVSDLPLTSVGSKTAVVFWMKYYYPTQVTFGIFYDNGDPAFQLEVSEKPQVLDGWDNQPLDVTMETGTWTMFGLTWDATSAGIFNIAVFKDGEMVLQLDISQDYMAEKLKMSAANGTFLSGLSVTNNTVDAAVMANVYEDCAIELTGAGYTLDDLAITRIPAMKFTGSTCKASNASVDVDHCGINRCKNNGICISNTVGYTCNCTETYGGPFCEESLVHGNWSEWYDAAGCSVTCGVGTQLKYRFCNNPARSEFGDDCVGNSTEVFECFLENCTVCEPPEVDGVATCEIDNDECEAVCPPGYVMPRGQQKQKFQCGETTSYNWMPMNRLPICTESRRPQSYSATLTFTFREPVPCEKANSVQSEMEKAESILRCKEENNNTCAASVEITDCTGDGGGKRRKRDTGTQLIIILSIPLTSNVTFDLVQYYITSIMTESILEAVTAISVLEQIIQDILSDPGQFTAVVGGVTYTVVSGSAFATTTTHCAVGEVPVEAVCAQCQKGTHATNGWCVYCDRGTYQATSGQTSCNACPNDGTTFTIGARSSVECIALPEEPKVTDLTGIIIIVVVVILCLIVIVLIAILACRFYRSAKDREKYDMEADRMSLYTDFPDIAYNVYFKRKQVLGFDESGYPVIGNTRYQNGSIKRPKVSTDADDDGRGSAVPNQEPVANQDENEAPFNYDPYAMWANESFVSPYEYPQEDTFDFPKIEHAVRYRVPGRQHFQNTYPLSQFGYDDSAHGRSRKNLPLPANIPIPKKLPQLMYRKPDSMSLADLLKSQFGFKKLKSEDLEEGIKFPLVNEETPVPPLSLKKQPGKKIVTKAKGRKLSTQSSAIRSTRSDGMSQRSPGRSRSATLWKAGAVMKAKLIDRSPRATSAISPRSISTGTPSPRPSTTMGRSPGRIEIDENAPHPKPSRYIVPKAGPLPKSFPLPKSALKVTIPDEPRPETGMTTGRKSVTIREDVNITRPSTTATTFRPSTAGVSPREHQRPTSDAKSARETIVAPYSARPRSSFMTISEHTIPLPSDVTEAYRPSSSFYRPVTPAEHPKPTLHSGVTVKRSSDHAMFFPPTNISFQQQPPVAHTIRQMQPPLFLNKVNPAPQIRRNSSLKRTRFDMGDNSDEISTNGSFFLTELPEELSASRASLAGSILSRTNKSSKKPSPPPDYSSSTRDKLIESSSMRSQYDE